MSVGHARCRRPRRVDGRRAAAAGRRRRRRSGRRRVQNRTADQLAAVAIVVQHRQFGTNATGSASGGRCSIDGLGKRRRAAPAASLTGCRVAASSALRQTRAAVSNRRPGRRRAPGRTPLAARRRRRRPTRADPATARGPEAGADGGRQIISAMSTARLNTSARRSHALAGDPFRGGVGPTDRRRHHDVLERLRDAQAGQPRVVGGEEHVPRVQRAVRRWPPRRSRARRPVAAATRAASSGGTGPILADRRVSSESAATKSCARYADAPTMPVASGAAMRRMGQIGGDQPCKLGHQLMHALGWQVEPKQLDRDQPFVLRIVGAEHRTEVPAPI